MSYNYRTSLSDNFDFREFSFAEVIDFSQKAALRFPNENGVSNTGYFYGSPSYAKTIEYAKNGNPEKTDRVRKLVERISGTYSFTSTSDYMMDVTGLCLDVATMLTGNPDHWMQPIETKALRSDKLIDISTEYSFSGGTNFQDIEFRGALIASLVDALRQRGFSVKLNIMHTHSYSSSGRKGTNTYRGYAGQVMKINLINFGEIPDLSTFAFYLADSSAYRRLIFSAMNGISGVTGTATRCYASEPPMQYRSKFHIESYDGLIRVGHREPTDAHIEQAQRWLDEKLKEISENY